MGTKQGFTLIELMIVIAIIAIIAAIAVPGLLASQRASNERNAFASLKTLATAEADFQTGDRDANRVPDYWTADVAGLYSLSSTSTPDLPIKLIDITVAGADVTGGQPIPTASAAVSGRTASTVAMSTLIQLSQKAGYWYGALSENNQTTTTYALITDGGATATHNRSWFGFSALPDVLNGSGNWVFILNESNTVFKMQPAPGTVLFTMPGSTPPVAIIAAFEDWPTDALFSTQWSKMD